MTLIFQDDSLEAGPSTSAAASSSEVSKKPKVYGTGIGKYINKNKLKRPNDEEEPSTSTAPPAVEKKKKAKVASKLNDFSEW